MRLSSLAIPLSLGAATLMALPALTTIAWAVQDQPVTIGALEMVCTGVGSAKDNPAWSIYPVKLTFSNLAGEYETAGHVVITQGGKTVMESDCDAPWLLIKAPPGHYDVHAALPGRVANASFTTGTRSGQQTVNLAFPGNKQAGNAMPSGAVTATPAAFVPSGSGTRAGSVVRSDNVRTGEEPDAASLGERQKQAANAMPSDSGAPQQAAYAMPKSLLPAKP